MQPKCKFVEETPGLKSKHSQQKTDVALLHFHTTNLSSHIIVDETLFHGFECQASVGGDFAVLFTVVQKHFSPRTIYGSILIGRLYLRQCLVHVAEPSQLT